MGHLLRLRHPLSLGQHTDESRQQPSARYGHELRVPRTQLTIGREMIRLDCGAETCDWAWRRRRREDLTRSKRLLRSSPVMLSS